MQCEWLDGESVVFNDAGAAASDWQQEKSRSVAQSRFRRRAEACLHAQQPSLCTGRSSEGQDVASPAS